MKNVLISSVTSGFVYLFVSYLLNIQDHNIFLYGYLTGVAASTFAALMSIL